MTRKVQPYMRGMHKLGKRTLWEDLFENEDWRISERAHEAQHGPSIVTYTSITTLDTVAGTKVRMPRGGEIVRVQCRVTTAPVSTAFKLDLLVDGVSVWESGTYLEVAATETVSKFKVPTGRVFFNEDSDVKFQVNTVSSAGGPYVATIEYLPGW